MHITPALQDLGDYADIVEFNRLSIKLQRHAIMFLQNKLGQGKTSPQLEEARKFLADMLETEKAIKAMGEKK